MKTSERYYAVKHNTHLVFSLHDNNMKKLASCYCKLGVSFLEIDEFKLQSVGKMKSWEKWAKKYGSVNRAVCLYKFHVMKN